MDEEVPPPPEGFVFSARSPFTLHNGPTFQRVSDEGLEQAFFALSRHCNSLGIVHGGMLSTFLDGAMARAVVKATRMATVTVHLSLDFLSPAREGDWLFSEAKVTRRTRDLVFVEGRVRTLRRDVLRGSGVFKPVRKRID